MVRFGGSILVDFDASWTTVLAFLHCYDAIPGVEEVCYASSSSSSSSSISGTLCQTCVHAIMGNSVLTSLALSIPHNRRRV